MAIKISGVTVLDNNQNFNVTGIASVGVAITMYGSTGQRLRDPSSFLKELEIFLCLNDISFEEDISYHDFMRFVNNRYLNIPTYLQIEHI